MMLRAVGVAAANGRAEIGEAGGDDGGKVAGSINANLHITLFSINRRSTRSLGSGAWSRARKSMVILLLEMATGGKYMYSEVREMAAS